MKGTGTMSEPKRPIGYLGFTQTPLCEHGEAAHSIVPVYRDKVSGELKDLSKHYRMHELADAEHKRERLTKSLAGTYGTFGMLHYHGCCETVAFPA